VRRERDGESLQTGVTYPGLLCLNRIRFERRQTTKSEPRRSDVRFPELPVRLGPTGAKNASRRQLALYDRSGFILTCRS